MLNNTKYSETQLINALKASGLILPSSENDIESFEAALQELDIPPLPIEFDNPNNIINGVFPNSAKIVSLFKDDESAKNLAMAAREGKSISSSVLDKMRKDREDAKNKK